MNESITADELSPERIDELNVHLDCLLQEYNRAQRRIKRKRKQADSMIAEQSKRIEDWFRSQTNSNRKTVSSLEPMIQDAVRRLLLHSKKKSVKLPNGSAGFHAAPRTFAFNGTRANAGNSALVDALAKANSEFISYYPKLDWDAMAKGLHIVNGVVCDKNGEVIDGLTLEVKPEQFYVKETKSDD